MGRLNRVKEIVGRVLDTEGVGIWGSLGALRAVGLVEGHRPRLPAGTLDLATLCGRRSRRSPALAPIGGHVARAPKGLGSEEGAWGGALRRVFGKGQLRGVRAGRGCAAGQAGGRQDRWVNVQMGHRPGWVRARGPGSGWSVQWHGADPRTWALRWVEGFALDAGRVFPDFIPRQITKVRKNLGQRRAGVLGEGMEQKEGPGAPPHPVHPSTPAPRAPTARDHPHGPSLQQEPRGGHRLPGPVQTAANSGAEASGAPRPGAVSPAQADLPPGPAARDGRAQRRLVGCPSKRGDTGRTAAWK